MNKICHFSSVHPIDDIRIFHKECVSLATNGYDVTLIACGENAFEDVVEGVKRISLSVPVKNRLQRFFKRSKVIYKKAIEINADIYHFHDPELFFIGWLLKYKKKTVVFDSHEDFPQQLKQKHYLGVLKIFVSFIAKLIDSYLSPKFDLIIATSPHIYDKYKKYGCNVVIVKNYPILNYNYIDWTNKLDRLCYIGGISENRGIFNMLDSLNKTDYVLELAGIFSEEDVFLRAKEHPAWSQVHYHGYISQNKLLEINSKSKIGFGLFHAAPNHSKGITTKLYEYMDAGLPVIVSDCVESNVEVVNKHKCGFIVNPTDIDRIANCINLLMKDDRLASEMGKRGKEAASKYYNWKNEEICLLDSYNKLLK